MPSEGLRNRIKRVNMAIERLKILSRLNKDDFLSDFRNIDSAERNFHIAIEGLLDIGNFIISHFELEAPSRYRDIGMILVRHKLLSADLGESLSNMAGFRNILIHGYTVISEDKLYEFLKTRITELLQVFKALLKIIEKHGIDP